MGQHLDRNPTRESCRSGIVCKLLEWGLASVVSTNVPNGQASIDAYMTWHPTWNGGRFVFVLVDGAASRNVWFGYSNDSAGTSWTIRSTAALVGGFNPSTGQFFNWDYPSIGVDSGGRIIIGAVASPGTDNRFFTTVSTDNGATFSTPSPVPATFGRNARVIGANGRFHAFLPTLDPITNTINKVDRWESTNGSTWTGPNLVASFPSGPPNQSASNVGGYPVFYSPFLDARGNANGNWAVVFPANYNGYSNTYICTNFRGCGFVNQGNGDEFLGGHPYRLGQQHLGVVQDFRERYYAPSGCVLFSTGWGDIRGDRL